MKSEEIYKKWTLAGYHLWWFGRAEIEVVYKDHDVLEVNVRIPTFYEKIVDSKEEEE